MQSAWWARFDGARLRAVPATDAATETVAEPVAQTLRDVLDWCHRDAGPARRDFWRPWALPMVEQRLAVALIGSKPTADAACLHIDGSGLLRARGNALSRLALRLRVKLHDALWWRARQRSDPWDSGVAIHAAALAGFWPRRATLIVLQADAIDAALHAVAELQARQSRLAHALRLLIVSPISEAQWALAWRDQQPVLPAWAAVRRFG